MAQSLNGSGTYQILGQDITLGSINADAWTYSDSGSFPFRSVAYEYVSSLFDGIEAVTQHNGGTFPTSDYTALWYDESLDTDPVFGIAVTYNGSGKFNLSYGLRNYSAPDYVWNGIISGHYYNDGYDGADPDDITDEDRWRQGIFFGYFSSGLTFLPSGNNRYVIVLQHKAPVTGYTGNPSTTTFDIATGYPGDRYYVDSGPCYYESTDGYGNTYQAPGLLYLLNSSLSKKVDNFKEDTSSTGGGNSGKYGYRSIKIGIPGLPGISIQDTGMASMWIPTPGQMLDLADFLWSDNFIDNIKKANADPLSNIIQFGVVPLDLASLGGTLTEVKVGNVGTGVNMTPLSRQYIQVDCGEISPSEYWSSSMDYEPNSRATFFLPFLGEVDVPMHEVYGKSIQLVYNIDLLSGDFVAFLRMHRGQLDSVLYHKTGNLLLSFPLSAANFSNFYKTVAAGVAGVAAGAVTGNAGQIASSLMDMAGSVISGGSEIQISRTGNFSGACSALSCFDAYMILTQCEQQMPANYGKYVGYPCYITYKLSDLTGFTKVEEVIDNTVAATDEEKAEIERLLKEGVIL